MAIKPSGVDYDKLRAEDMVIVSLVSGQVVEGGKRPSSDTKTHVELYRAFDNNRRHRAYAFISCHRVRPGPSGNTLLGTTHADHFYGTIPVTRQMTKDEINGEYELTTGHVIVERFREGKIDPDEMRPCWWQAMRRSFWGKTPEKALENAVALEYVAGCKSKASN